MVEKITAMQEAANRVETAVSTIHIASWNLKENELKNDSLVMIR